MPQPTISEKSTKPNLPYFDEVAYTLSDARVVNLFGDIHTSSAAHVINSLDYLTIKNAKKPISIRLNSPGGSVIDGLAIYDKIKDVVKKTPVNITVNGACMSMATVILQAATTRLAYPNSEFLLHEIQYGMRGSHSEQKDYQKQAQRLQDRLNAILSGRSGVGLKELEKLIERRDYTISAAEALEFGLIDNII